MKFKNVFLFLLAAVSPALAQQATTLGPARVTLVAGPSPSRGARVEVVRRSARSPQNVIIVDRNATADDLVAALAMINAMRSQQGDALTHDFRARPDVVRHGPRWQESEYRAWLVDQLVRLRQAPQRAMSDLGVVRSVQITLPAPKVSAAGSRD